MGNYSHEYKRCDRNAGGRVEMCYAVTSILKVGLSLAECSKTEYTDLYFSWLFIDSILIFFQIFT